MEKVFTQIVRAIKAGEPEILEFNGINPEDASRLTRRLRLPSNDLERHGHRYLEPPHVLSSLWLILSN